MHDDRTRALASIYATLTRWAQGSSAADFSRQSGCADWTCRELLFHILLDAQRALMTLAVPVPDEADTDAVSYWHSYATALDEQENAAHTRFVRRSADAYRSPPDGLVRHWSDTAQAAAVAAGRADGTASVRTQGRVLTVSDFVDTLVVEATIHYLDLTWEDQTRPAAPADALRVTRRTLERLLGRSAPASWSDAAVARRLTGREPLDAATQRELGEAAATLPLFT